MRTFSLVITAAVVAFAAVVLMQQFSAASGRQAFEAVRADYRTSLGDAMAESERTGKPIYALVTASWCAPCQVLKGNVLANDSVASVLREDFVPVYLEETAAAEDLATLPITVRSVYPTSIVIDGGEIIAVLEGAASRSAFEGFLDEALAKTDAASAAPSAEAASR